MDSNGKSYRNARNLASGSAGALNPTTCKERSIYFYVINIIKGLDDYMHIADSRHALLSSLSDFGFGVCPSVPFSCQNSMERLNKEMEYLKNFQDIYHLDRYRDEIINLDGFGEKSYAKIWSSIEQSRNTTFVRYLVAMDIPLIGRTVSRKLDQCFNGNLNDLEVAALGSFDFTSLDDVGDILSNNIHQWFHDAGNVDLWRNLQKEFKFERKEEIIMNEDKTNIFEGCTIVATEKLENFTRDSINSKICSLDASAAESVTKKQIT